MLPPIYSVSNSTVQNRVPPRQEKHDHQRGGQGQNPGTRQGQTAVSVSNAAVARVNILNIPSTDGLTPDLSRLSLAIGKALDMPLMRGETEVMHAIRIAGAIFDLNPGPNMALERQLNHILQGLPLQLVALALRNPGGAEAARIAAYLELNRQKGDAVTQAIVASYIQNEGSDEDDILDQPNRQGRTGGPEIELKGRTVSTQIEEQLSLAAQSAATRIGLALPYVAYLHDDFEIDADGENEDRPDEDGAREEGEQPEEHNRQSLEAHEEESAEDEAGEESGDDLAYSYYQRMSGGL